MYDRQTETWWQQATGEAIAGEMTGMKLEFYPAVIIAWREFKTSYPHGKVLSRETGYLRDYGKNPYIGYDDVNNPPFLYQGPVTPGRLPPVARVLTIDLNSEVVAYPYETLETIGAVNDTVGGEAVVVFAVLGVAIAGGFEYLPAMRWHWLDDLIALGGVIGFLVALWLFFPAVVSVFIGLWLDDVAEAVERRHYPTDPPGTAPSLGLSIVLALRLMGALVLLNLILLPVYIVALFIPFLSLALFLLLNGYLLGREYFELVATRHMSPAEARIMRKASGGRIYLAGMVIAGLFAVPFLNLLAPILGAAFMMHVYKALPTRQNSFVK